MFFAEFEEVVRASGIKTDFQFYTAQLKSFFSVTVKAIPVQSMYSWLIAVKDMGPQVTIVLITPTDRNQWKSIAIK